MLRAEDIQPALDGWKQIDGAGRTRRWRNAAGDQLTHDFFEIPPDLAGTPAQIDRVRAQYRSGLGTTGGLVEVDALRIHGLAAVGAILKIRQQPTGMTYLAALTIPFRDCSFVLKWQCPEQGITGVRDTIVFAKMSLPVDASGRPQGWMADPYLPSHAGPVLRNRSDDVEWDARFPSHPLTRARGYLSGASALRVTERTAQEPTFER